MRIALATALAATLVVGCDKKESSSSGASNRASETSVEKGEVARTSLGPAVFGTKPAPVGALAKLTLGQSDAEARKAAPALFPHADRLGEIVDSEYEGVKYVTAIDKETKLLERIYLQVPASAAAVIAQAWGPGTAATDSIDRPRTYWFDPETGWRAHLEQGFGESLTLDFTRYTPMAAWIGAGGDTLAFAPEGIVGKTLPELRAQFKDKLVEEDSATAAAKRAELETFVGKDLDAEIGKAKPSVSIKYLPLEWESYETNVHIFWGDDGKVLSSWFKIPFQGHPAAKEQIRAFLDAKWGAPKEAKEFGAAGDPIWVYREKDPRITLKEDTISKGWDVKLDAKAD